MAQALSETELLALVDRLADGQWHSGEDLAAASGISRAALAKRVAKLADWQLVVEARQGLGYRLPQALERLDPAQLQAAVPQLRVQVLPVTDSTSTQVMAAPADADPQAVLAEVQTAGRGRRGRQWVSPFGAQLAVSLAWSFDAMPPQLGALPLAVGVVCAEVLRQHGLQSVGLKWPNDILVDGRKLGGILLEHRGEAGGGCRIVAGIGINLDLPPGPDAQIDQPFINLDDALAALGRPRCGRNALAAELLRALFALFSGYGLHGFAPLAARWSELDVTRDRRVHIFRGGQGDDQRFEAYARGVDADGALIVESGGQRQVLHSGEVSLRV